VRSAPCSLSHPDRPGHPPDEVPIIQGRRSTTPLPLATWTTGEAGGERRRAAGQALPQVLPLRVKPVGLPALPVWVAWKPMLTEPFGGMAAL